MPFKFQCQLCHKIFTAPKSRPRRYCGSSCYGDAKRGKPVDPSKPPTKWRLKNLKRESGLTRVYQRSHDPEFLNEWSDDLGWLTGLIWTDGNLHCNRIQIASKDIEMLRDVTRIVGSEGRITKWKDKNLHCVRFGSEHVANFFGGLGLIERKSLTIQWPTGIPPKYQAAFLRGVFDGDGCIYVGKRQHTASPRITATFTTASESFKDSLGKFLFENQIDSRTKVQYSPISVNPCWAVTIARIESLARLFDLLYPSPLVTKLERKYSKWVAVRHRFVDRRLSMFPSVGA